MSRPPQLPDRVPSRHNLVGLALVICGVLALAVSAALVAIVVWLEMAQPGPASYVAVTIRAVVLGGFFLFLGWLMLRVGKSLLANPRRLIPDTPEQGR